LGHQEDALFTKSGIKILSKSTAPPEKSTRAKLHLQKHRLAVDKSKCIGCGRCLDGCPTNAIWFAGDEWKLIPNITFKNNHYVTKIEQIAEKVIVTVEGQPNALVYDSLYVACGTIGTAILLMKSKMIPDTVSFSDSQTIFIPFIKSPIKDSGFSFSLSQISFKIDLPGFNPLHLQIYPDTRNMSGRVEIFSPRFGFLLVRIWNYLSRFLSAGILYLDGANSQKLELRLIDDGKFILSPKTSVEAIGQTKYALKESVKAVRSIGLFGLTYFAKIAAPGEGYHFGAIDALQNVHSDGSLPAASNIHIVDGSVLKSIPAGPITPSIMENARIITRNSLPHEK
jgi:ferredoxin